MYRAPRHGHITANPSPQGFVEVEDISYDSARDITPSVIVVDVPYYNNVTQPTSGPQAGGTLSKALADWATYSKKSPNAYTLSIYNRGRGFFLDILRKKPDLDKGKRRSQYFISPLTESTARARKTIDVKPTQFDSFQNAEGEPETRAQTLLGLYTHDYPYQNVPRERVIDALRVLNRVLLDRTDKGQSALKVAVPPIGCAGGGLVYGGDGGVYDIICEVLKPAAEAGHTIYILAPKNEAEINPTTTRGYADPGIAGSVYENSTYLPNLKTFEYTELREKAALYALKKLVTENTNYADTPDEHIRSLQDVHNRKRTQITKLLTQYGATVQDFVDDRAARNGDSLVKKIAKEVRNNDLLNQDARIAAISDVSLSEATYVSEREAYEKKREALLRKYRDEYLAQNAPQAAEEEPLTPILARDIVETYDDFVSKNEEPPYTLDRYKAAQAYIENPFHGVKSISRSAKSLAKGIPQLEEVLKKYSECEESEDLYDAAGTLVDQREKELEICTRLAKNPASIRSLETNLAGILNPLIADIKQELVSPDDIVTRMSEAASDIKAFKIGAKAIGNLGAEFVAQEIGRRLVDSYRQYRNELTQARADNKKTADDRDFEFEKGKSRRRLDMALETVVDNTFNDLLNQTAGAGALLKSARDRALSLYKDFQSKNAAYDRARAAYENSGHVFDKDIILDSITKVQARHEASVNAARDVIVEEQAKLDTLSAILLNISEYSESYDEELRAKIEADYEEVFGEESEDLLHIAYRVNNSLDGQPAAVKRARAQVARTEKRARRWRSDLPGVPNLYELLTKDESSLTENERERKALYTKLFLRGERDSNALRAAIEQRMAGGEYKPSFRSREEELGSLISRDRATIAIGGLYGRQAGRMVILPKEVTTSAEELRRDIKNAQKKEQIALGLMLPPREPDARIVAIREKLESGLPLLKEEEVALEIEDKIAEVALADVAVNKLNFELRADYTDTQAQLFPERFAGGAPARGSFKAPSKERKEQIGNLLADLSSERAELDADLVALSAVEIAYKKTRRGIALSQTESALIEEYEAYTQELENAAQIAGGIIPGAVTTLDPVQRGSEIAARFKARAGGRSVGDDLESARIENLRRLVTHKNKMHALTGAPGKNGRTPNPWTLRNGPSIDSIKDGGQLYNSLKDGGQLHIESTSERERLAEVAADLARVSADFKNKKFDRIDEIEKQAEQRRISVAELGDTVSLEYSRLRKERADIKNKMHALSNEIVGHLYDSLKDVDQLYIESTPEQERLAEVAADLARVSADAKSDKFNRIGEIEKQAKRLGASVAELGGTVSLEYSRLLKERADIKNQVASLAAQRDALKKQIESSPESRFFEDAELSSYYGTVRDDLTKALEALALSRAIREAAILAQVSEEAETTGVSPGKDFDRAHDEVKEALDTANRGSLTASQLGDLGKAHKDFLSLFGEDAGDIDAAYIAVNDAEADADVAQRTAIYYQYQKPDKDNAAKKIVDKYYNRVEREEEVLEAAKKAAKEAEKAYRKGAVDKKTLDKCREAVVNAKKIQDASPKKTERDLHEEIIAELLRMASVEARDRDKLPEPGLSRLRDALNKRAAAQREYDRLLAIKQSNKVGCMRIFIDAIVKETGDSFVGAEKATRKQLAGIKETSALMTKVAADIRKVNSVGGYDASDVISVPSRLSAVPVGPFDPVKAAKEEDANTVKEAGKSREQRVKALQKAYDNASPVDRVRLLQRELLQKEYREYCLREYEDRGLIYNATTAAEKKNLKEARRLSDIKVQTDIYHGRTDEVTGQTHKLPRFIQTGPVLEDMRLPPGMDPPSVTPENARKHLKEIANACGFKSWAQFQRAWEELTPEFQRKQRARGTYNKRAALDIKDATGQSALANLRRETGNPNAGWAELEASRFSQKLRQSGDKRQSALDALYDYRDDSESLSDFARDIDIPTQLEAAVAEETGMGGYAHVKSDPFYIDLAGSKRDYFIEAEISRELTKIIRDELLKRDKRLAAMVTTDGPAAALNLAVRQGKIDLLEKKEIGKHAIELILGRLITSSFEAPYVSPVGGRRRYEDTSATNAIVDFLAEIEIAPRTLGLQAVNLTLSVSPEAVENNLSKLKRDAIAALDAETLKDTVSEYELENMSPRELATASPENEARNRVCSRLSPAQTIIYLRDNDEHFDAAGEAIISLIHAAVMQSLRGADSGEARARAFLKVLSDAGISEAEIASSVARGAIKSGRVKSVAEVSDTLAALENSVLSAAESTPRVILDPLKRKVSPEASIVGILFERSGKGYAPRRNVESSGLKARIISLIKSALEQVPLSGEFSTATFIPAEASRVGEMERELMDALNLAITLYEERNSLISAAPSVREMFPKTAPQAEFGKEGTIDSLLDTIKSCETVISDLFKRLAAYYDATKTYAPASLKALLSKAAAEKNTARKDNPGAASRYQARISGRRNNPEETLWHYEETGPVDLLTEGMSGSRSKRAMRRMNPETSPVISAFSDVFGMTIDTSACDTAHGVECERARCLVRLQRDIAPEDVSDVLRELAGDRDALTGTFLKRVARQAAQSIKTELRQNPHREQEITSKLQAAMKQCLAC
jgi:hypothetical protein